MDPKDPFHQQMMALAIDVAKEALLTNDVPIGAVLSKDGKLIASACNRKVADNDLTAHAEVLVIKKAAALLGDWRLEGTQLYVTLEPCAMCAGTILQARIQQVIFGLKDEKTGACGSFLSILNQEKLKRPELLYYHTEESAELLKSFFKTMRAKG